MEKGRYMIALVNSIIWLYAITTLGILAARLGICFEEVRGHRSRMGRQEGGGGSEVAKYLVIPFPDYIWNLMDWFYQPIHRKLSYYFV